MRPHPRLRVVFVVLALPLTWPTVGSAQHAAAGTFTCDGARIAMRTAIARWEASNRRLELLLFGRALTPEEIGFWTQPALPRSWPPEKGYLGKLRLTVRSDAPQPRHEDIESFFLYVDCPAIQLNVTRGGDPAVIRRDVPDFQATLTSGGSVRLATRGAHQFAKNKLEWDLRLDAKVYTY